MVQDSSASPAGPAQPGVIARPVGEDTVLTLVAPVGRGPWPFITGIPNPEANLAGPPAEYLALAGWAA